MLCVNPIKLGRFAKGDRPAPAQNQFNPHHCTIKTFFLYIRLYLLKAHTDKPIMLKVARFLIPPTPLQKEGKEIS
jgi:hypothetical protein